MVEEIIDTKDHQKQEDAPSTESSVDNKYDVPSDELSKKSKYVIWDFNIGHSEMSHR